MELTIDTTSRKLTIVDVLVIWHMKRFQHTNINLIDDNIAKAASAFIVDKPEHADLLKIILYKLIYSSSSTEFYLGLDGGKTSSARAPRGNFDPKEFQRLIIEGGIMFEPDIIGVLDYVKHLMPRPTRIDPFEQLITRYV